MYLVFPNPKVRKFIAAVGNTKWWWLRGRRVRRRLLDRPSDKRPDDRIDYNDIRVIGGLEWETQTQIRGHIEVGYVFDRENVFGSGDPPNFKPNDTIMLRAGVNF